jgi:hypothetical protein
VDPVKILKENEQRWNALNAAYDPVRGIGSPLKRIEIALDDNTAVRIPERMTELDGVRLILKHRTLARTAAKLNRPYEDMRESFNRIRCAHDFEFWSSTCVTIETKREGLQRFVLKRPQRKLFKILIQLFYAGVPIRIILLKARQWGGSTLVQIFIAWIQLFHKTHWHSFIIADTKDKAHHIRAMYERLAQYHPRDVLFDISAVRLKRYQGMQNFKEVAGRSNIIGVTSIESPESPRSFTFHLLHLSEVGVWKSSEKINAESFMQGLEGSLVDGPMTLCVKESTAKGVGNYFHRAWQAAEKGESLDQPVFVAWFEDVGYITSIEDKTEFVRSLSEYDLYLWTLGVTLEQIAWYRQKLKAYEGDEFRMKQEYPTTAKEAFQTTGMRIFTLDRVQRARAYCRIPVAVGHLYGEADKGEKALSGLRFVRGDRGDLSIWSFPKQAGIERAGKTYTNRYCAFLDIGGRHREADWSVLTVLDRIYTFFGGVPVVAADFRIHLDQDLMAWYAARVCHWYDDALLAIEVNSLKQKRDIEEPDHSYTVLDEIKDFYQNLYYRIRPELIQDRWSGVLGFHTNEKTKDMIVQALDGALRDESYEERSLMACDEMDSFEQKPDGSQGSQEGTHDDLVISRAGSYWLHTQMDPVQEIDTKRRETTARPGHVAIFT